jgi:hypothetical protein
MQYNTLLTKPSTTSFEDQNSKPPHACLTNIDSIQPPCPWLGDPSSAHNALPWLGLTPSLIQVGTVFTTYVLLLFLVPNASHPSWSVLGLLVHRSKPSSPHFTTLDQSCTNSLLDLLLRLSTTSTHPDTCAFTSLETCCIAHLTLYNIIPLELAIDIIKHIWTMNSTRKASYLSTLVSMIHHTWIRQRHFSTWSLTMLLNILKNRFLGGGWF